MVLSAWGSLLATVRLIVREALSGKLSEVRNMVLNG
jgi:hypothetical protein